MTNQTRDRLLISMAIMLHRLVDDNPTLFVSDESEDKEALWMAITKATAEHHREVREQDEHLAKAVEDAEILRNFHNGTTLVGMCPKEVVHDLQEQLKALEEATWH